MANLEQKNWQWIGVYPILNLCMLCTSQQQFWSELILVISHRTRAKSHVWFQTKLHSTQFNDNYLSLRLEWGLFKSLKKKGKKQAQWTNKVVEGSNVYDWPCFLFAKAMTVLTIDFQMAFWSVQTILLLFSSCLIFIQLCDSKQTHYLTHEFRVKLHLKTDIARISSQYARYRLSYAI